MRVLLTGGAGFIGSHLTDALVGDGHRVLAIDNFCSSSRKNVEHLSGNELFELLERDVLDVDSVEGELDYIMHFASRASPPDYQENPLHTLRTNSEGTLNMLNIAREKGARFMFASTSEVYGNPEVHPQHEDYWGKVNPVGPRACYDEGKRYGEALVTSFARQHDLDWRIVRIFNTYGPRMRPDDGRVISNFLTQALRNEPLTVYGDGKQTRSFCYIDDMISGILTAMESDSGEIFNLGNPDEERIIDLAERVKEMAGTESKIVFEDLPEDDPERRCPDISRSRERLGWEPGIDLEEGLRTTKDYFEECL